MFNVSGGMKHSSISSQNPLENAQYLIKEVMSENYSLSSKAIMSTFVMDVKNIRLQNIFWGTETITSMNEFYQRNDVDSLSSNKELTVFLKESCLNTAVGHSIQ